MKTDLELDWLLSESWLGISYLLSKISVIQVFRALGIHPDSEDTARNKTSNAALP